MGCEPCARLEEQVVSTEARTRREGLPSGPHLGPSPRTEAPACWSIRSWKGPGLTPERQARCWTGGSTNGLWGPGRAGGSGSGGDDASHGGEEEQSAAHPGNASGWPGGHHGDAVTRPLRAGGGKSVGEAPVPENGQVTVQRLPGDAGRLSQCSPPREADAGPATPFLAETWEAPTDRLWMNPRVCTKKHG